MPWSILGWRKGVNKKESQINSIENIFIETPEIVDSCKLIKNLKIYDQETKVAETSSLLDFGGEKLEQTNKKPFSKLSKFLLKHNSNKQLDGQNCCDTSDSSSLESTYSNIKLKERLKLVSVTKADSLPSLNDVSKIINVTENEKKVTNELCKFFANKSTEWNEYNNNLVDSHCHIEMVFFKIGYEKSLDKYFQEYSNIYLKNFEFCINVICDPYKYNKFSKNSFNNYLKKFNHPKCYSTIGCHPHFAKCWTSYTKDLIYNALKSPENQIIAIGECGLDSSHKNKVNLTQQINVFEDQISIAKETKLPIVIHCRNNELEVFELLKKNLNSKHKIHLHCFTGGWEMGSKYLETFDNLCIGVTPLIAYCAEVKELVYHIPLDRLLLETDSPYFIPKEVPSNDKISHPAYIYYTAQMVADLKNVSINQVINSNRENVKKIYSV